MTQRDSGHDFDPKHRIIGAVVVVTLAVIFIPMVLGERAPRISSNTQESVTAAASAPATGNKVAVTKVTPLASVSEAPAPKAPPAPAPAKTPAVAAEPRPVASAPAPVDAKRPASGWVVQVGTFANTANATRLEQKLRAEGQTVLVERVEVEAGKAVRLRVGPFRDRTAAAKAQERIHKELGVQGVVLAYP